MASTAISTRPSCAHANREIPLHLRLALNTCAQLMAEIAQSTPEGLKKVTEIVEKTLGVKNAAPKTPFRFPKNVYGNGVIVEEKSGTFRLRINTVEDAAAYIEHAKIEMIDVVNGVFEQPEYAKNLIHSSKEAGFVLVKFGIKINDVHIIYQSVGRPSTQKPATTFHFQAATIAQVLLSPETLLKSFSQIRDLDDAQTQREWITIELLEEAAKWPLRQADARRAEVLNSHIRMLARFDRNVRKNGTSYASPFKIPENIALSKIWLDHIFSIVSTSTTEQIQSSTLSDGTIVNATLLDDVLTVHQNMYEIWKNSPNFEAKKKVVEIIDDAKFLAEIIFMIQHPTESTETASRLERLFKVEREIYDIKPASVVAVKESEKNEFTPEEVAEIERMEDEEAAQATNQLQESLSSSTPKHNIHETIESVVAAQSQSEAQKTLKLERNGNLTLPNRESSSADWVLRVDAQESQTSAQNWSVHLNRVSKKDWLDLSKYSDAKGAIFFKRMNQALGTILKVGYYQALNMTGFPFKKQINGTPGYFELILGSERRIVYSVNNESRTITVTSISAHHNVSYE